jgi:hypothetical protein
LPLRRMNSTTFAAYTSAWIPRISGVASIAPELWLSATPVSRPSSIGHLASVRRFADFVGVRERRFAGYLLRMSCVVIVLLGVGVTTSWAETERTPGANDLKQQTVSAKDGTGISANRAAAERLVHLQYLVARTPESRENAAIQKRVDTLLLTVLEGSKSATDVIRDIEVLERDVAAQRAKKVGTSAAAVTRALSPPEMNAVSLPAVFLSILALALSLFAVFTRGRVVKKALKDAGLI